MSLTLVSVGHVWCLIRTKQILLESLLQEVCINQPIPGTSSLDLLRWQKWDFYSNLKRFPDILPNQIEDKGCIYYQDIIEKAYVIDSCFCRACLLSNKDQANFAWFTSTRSVYQPVPLTISFELDNLVLLYWTDIDSCFHWACSYSIH